MAAAGLLVGDIVVSVNGITIENYNHAVGLLRASVGPTRVTVKRAGGVEATPGSGAVANSVGASVGRTREQLLRDSDEAWAAARATEARVEELEAQLVEWRLEDETVERMPIEQLVRLGEELAEKQKRVRSLTESFARRIQHAGLSRGWSTWNGQWRLLKEVIEAENWHLMDAVWFWSMGFSNLCHRFLQPPPDVETAAQRSRRETHEQQERAAATIGANELREAAAAGARAAAAIGAGAGGGA